MVIIMKLNHSDKKYFKPIREHARILHELYSSNDVSNVPSVKDLLIRKLQIVKPLKTYLEDNVEDASIDEDEYKQDLMLCEILDIDIENI